MLRKFGTYFSEIRTRPMGVLPFIGSDLGCTLAVLIVAIPSLAEGEQAARWEKSAASK